MARLYKMSIWQSATGDWYTNCVDDLAGVSGKWWVPAKIFGISAPAFVAKLITDYKPDKIKYSIEHDVLIYSWRKEHYNAANRFVLDVNKQARLIAFMV